MNNQRWGIYIDIEGFRAKFDDDLEALNSLRALMEGIYSVGTKVYYDDVKRIFAHQLGDGFIIVSCFHEDILDRAISITIALMRHVLASGGIAKASIAEGNFADINSCYPKCILESQKESTGNNSLRLGRGIMATIPVMGTALINAIGVDKQAPSGSLLTLRSKDSDRISEDFTVTKIENNLISVNWIKDEPSLVSEIVTKADFVESSETERIKMLNKYIENNNLSPNWVRTTRYELGISI